MVEDDDDDEKAIPKTASNGRGQKYHSVMRLILTFLV